MTNDLRRHWETLMGRVEESRSIWVLSEFDGTLARVVGHPGRAALSVRARRVLLRLSRNPRVSLGLMSGRSLRDLQGRVGLEDAWYVGNHGYEVRAPGEPECRFYTPEDVEGMAEVAAQLKRETESIPGVILENKGPIVAVHYRQVERVRVAEVEKAFLRVLEPRHRQVMMGHGNCVLEARLRGSSNKGTAMLRIRRDSPAGIPAVYFGDDQVDRDVFRLLGPGDTGVAVGRVTSGVAEFSLPGPTAVLEVLDRLDLELRGLENHRPGTRRSLAVPVL